MGLTEMIAAGGTNPVLLFGFALMLGALHGLEPGHSKTMMAAYIIAVRGTVGQAVILGLSAALSHSIIVWILSWIALAYGNELIGEELEPYFMIVSGAIVLGIAAWMLWNALRPRHSDHGHHHDQDHSYDHHHHHHAHDHHHHDHDHHHHDHSHDHDHDHGTAALHSPHMDAHARAHAAEIEARLAEGKTGTWQTVLFGLSGGLIPCPAAITVFILCLYLGQVSLGIILVGAFSAGLAITLVLIGVIAALGLKYLSSKNGRFNAILNASPWISAVLVGAVGVLIISYGWSLLGHGHTHG